MKHKLTQVFLGKKSLWNKMSFMHFVLKDNVMRRSPGGLYENDEIALRVLALTGTNDGHFARKLSLFYVSCTKSIPNSYTGSGRDS